MTTRIRSMISVLIKKAMSASLPAIALTLGCGIYAQTPADTAAVKPIRVACVGDSITLGTGTKDPANESYPAQLQKMLGEKWEVKNFGAGGRTVLRKADPFALGRALKYQPDVVIIMLGTNDSKDYAWGRFKAEFVGDYTGIVKEFQKLETHPKVWVCLPAPAFPGNWGITDKVIAENIIPSIKKAAEECKVPVIDLHTPLQDAKASFPDKIHPNKDGAQRIAEIVAKSISAN